MRSETGSKSVRVLPVVLILAAAVLPYLHSLRYPFVNWDDFTLIVGNEYIKELSWTNIRAMFTPGVVGAFQPLRNLSYAIDHLFWGMNPLGFRLTNLLLYALTCLGVFYFINRLVRSRAAALVGAILFAVHPIHVEAVTWLSARKEVLSGIFYLLGFISYMSGVAGKQVRWRYYLLSVSLFLLGALSKPTTVSFPAILFLYDLCFVTGGKLRPALARLRWHAPYWVVAVAVTAVTIMVSAQGAVLKGFHGGSLGSNLSTVAVAFPKSIALLILPVNLSPRYVSHESVLLLQPEGLISLFSLIMLALVMLDLWRRSSLLFFSLAWLVVALMPMSNLVPTSTLIADRYLYIPSFGFCLLAAVAFGNLLGTNPARRFLRALRKVGLIAAVCVLVAFSVLSFNRNFVWQDTVALWSNAVEQDPGNTLALYALGGEYMRSGNLEDAIEAFRRCLIVSPYYTDARVALGQCYAMQGNLDRSIFHFKQALIDTAAARSVYGDFALVLQARGSYEQAIKHYRVALGMDTTDTWVRDRLAECYAESELFDAAIVEWKELLKLSKDEMPARLHYNLGVLYHMKGEHEKALAAYEEAIRADSSFIDAYFGAANSHLALGKTEKAKSLLQKVLDYVPNHVGALNNLGNMYYDAGLLDEALDYYEKAARAEPESPKVLNNLGLVYGDLAMHEKAIDVFHEALAIDSSNVTVLLNLGSAYADAEEFGLAEAEYRKALVADSTNAIAHYNLACCYALQARNELALDNLRKALELGFSDHELLMTDPDLNGLRSTPGFPALEKALEEGKY